MPLPNSSDPPLQLDGTERGAMNVPEHWVGSIFWKVGCLYHSNSSPTHSPHLHALFFPEALCSKDRDQLPWERRSCFRVPTPNPPHHRLLLHYEEECATVAQAFWVEARWQDIRVVSQGPWQQGYR